MSQTAQLRYASANGGQCAHAARVRELEAEVATLKAKLRRFASSELATPSRRTATAGSVPAPPDLSRYIQSKRGGMSNVDAMAAARR